MIVNCSLIIDNSNLENIFFSEKCKRFRKKVEKKLIEGNNVSNIVINQNFINLNMIRMN